MKPFSLQGLRIAVCASPRFALACATRLQQQLPEAQVFWQPSGSDNEVNAIAAASAGSNLGANGAQSNAASSNAPIPSSAELGHPLADVALVWKPHAEFFSQQTALKAIFNLGAGVDALLDLPTLPRTVPLIRLEDAGMAQPMAEYVLAAVLRAYRGFPRYAAQQRQAQWAPHRTPQKSEFPIGVLGIGEIGSAVGQHLSAAGFSVRGYSRSPRAVDGITTFAGEQLPQFLAGLKVLVSLMPLTADNRGMLNWQLLEQLAPGAYVINVGRGAHLVEADLLALIDNGHLAGATLDVFETEPLPPEHPFWARPEIEITPHVSAATDVAGAITQIAEKLRALARGEAVSGVVNSAAGY